MNEIRSTRLGGRIGLAALAFVALVAWAACAPGEGGDARLSVRNLEVRTTAADGSVFEGGAIDSIWTIPGADIDRFRRSLVIEPRDASEVPNPMVDLAVGALVTGFNFNPPDDPPEDIQITEDNPSGLLEISLQRGVTFRATVVADYRRDADLAWRGTGEFGDYTVWIDGTSTPADTLRLELRGEYEDVRDAEGGRRAVLRGEGTLYVASAGEYAVEVTERVETTAMAAERVARRLEDVREEVGWDG